MTTLYTIIDSLVGALLLTSEGGPLTGLRFMDGPKAAAPGEGWLHARDAFARPAGQLREYFAGERRAFELELAPRGSAFELGVWEQLRAIPYGETATYGEIARLVGSPGAARAVGLANGRNPIAVIVPCHRVIGADGSLTGFGGGLPRKRELLELEAAGRFAPRLFGECRMLS
jgi:methylated-DNA-[protein]-cysteine S-methyltransferase